MKHHYTTSAFENSRKQKSFFVFLLAVLGCGSLFSQASYTFTPCGATGSLGPTQTQVNTAYQNTNLNGLVTSVNGIQHFTVPTAGMYRVSALGAQGGGAGGGYGALIEGDFSFSANEVIRIVVGQRGITQSGEPNACAGSGGSYVVRSAGNTTTDIVVIAGGGGGSPATYSISRHASTSTSGNWGAGASNTDGAPGTNGNGGNKSVAANTQDRAAGGGGFFTDGQSIQQSGFLGAAQGGTAFVNGSYGGSHNTTGAPGGFGGGGAVWTTGHKGGGGGGGFSGGGGGQTSSSNSNTHCGGGGGSFNNGTNQSNAVSTATGDGVVVITELCSMKLSTSSSGTLNPAVLCAGSSLTITTDAVSGYSWSTGATTSSIVVAPTTNTVYSVTGTSSMNCVATRIMSVTVSSGLPVLSISNPSNNICLGRTVSVTATGALSYTWSNPGVVNGQTFTPSSTAIYTVMGQNGCGVSTATTMITVSPLQVNVLASPTIVCQGSTSTLTAVSSVSGYTWEPNSMPGSTVAVAPVANTIYTVTASDGTCSGSQTVLVASKPTPTVSVASSVLYICEGTTATLSATGADSYSWNPGNIAGNTVTVSPATSSLYVVTGENTVGCSSSNQIAVVVYNSPTLNITSSKNLVCTGGTVALTASGGDSYNWVNGPSTAVFNVTPTASGIYTVVGSHNTNSCTATQTVSISVLIPNVSFPSNTMVCTGGTVSLTASGASTYTWNSVPTGTNNVFTMQPAATTTVTVIANTQSASVNCPVSQTVQIVVNPLPTLTVTPARAGMCRNETNTLTVTGAVSYDWGTLGTTNTVVITPTTTAAIYTVTGTDANNCTNKLSYQAKVFGCVGLGEIAPGAGISIYPNPNSGSFKLEADRDMMAEVYNELGQQLRTIQVREGLTDIDLNELSNGIYFIKTVSGEKSSINKLIICR